MGGECSSKTRLASGAVWTTGPSHQTTPLQKEPAIYGGALFLSFQGQHRVLIWELHVAGAVECACD